MIRVVKVGGTVVAVALTLLLSAGWWYGTSAPPDNRLPLASPLIDATSIEGRSLLESTPFRVDHDPLSNHFVTQSRRAYCGVASSTIIVNALRNPNPPLSQQTLFTPQASTVRSSIAVTFGGLTLEQLAELLRAHDLSVSLTYASEANLESFRSIARASLSDPSDFLVANCDRKVLNQDGTGHISPVSAYHEKSDRFLVLDVAAYKYPPTCVPAVDLWKAMNTIDATSGKSRGFLLIRTSGAQRTPRGDSQAFQVPCAIESSSGEPRRFNAFR